MKHLKKPTKILSNRVVPIVLVAMMVISMTAMAFSYSIIASSLSGEVADFTDVEVGSGNDESKAHWVDATYYDYLTDTEMGTDKWLEPDKSGTGFKGSDNDWYPYDKLNEFISNNSANNPYPLYFGNFCNNFDAYYNHDGTENPHGGPYREVTKNLKNFNYLANNSNGLDSYNTSVSGLVSDTLNNGQITDTSGTPLPQFNNQLLHDNNMAKIITSSFPFRESKVGDVTTYTFKSDEATDNVFFNWDGKTPTSVGYGQKGSNPDKYGVKDGLNLFMEDTESGYGIFPFNNTDQTKSGRGGNSNLDYGFGIKLNIDFKVPADGKLPNGEDVKFEYEGDDDIWIYLSDRDGSNSELVLDLGGDHKKATGKINFATMKSTADKSTPANAQTEDAIFIYDSMNWGSDMRVWAWDEGGLGGQWYTPKTIDTDTTTLYYVSESQTGSSGTPFSQMDHFKVCKGNWDENPTQNSDYEAVISERLNKVSYNDNLKYDKLGDMTLAPASSSVTKQFHGGNKLDPNKVYHMTIFYMERGMLESNCDMMFTMTPAQNLLTVTNKVNVDGINPALQEKVRASEAFNYLTTETGSTKQYTDTINDGQKKDYDNLFETDAKLKVKQTEQSPLQFSTDYTVTDRANNNSEVDSGSFSSTDDKTINEFELINRNDPLDTASMQVDFVNTPDVGNLIINKSQLDSEGNSENTPKSFGYELLIDLKDGDGYQPYELTYRYGSNTGAAPTTMKMDSNGQFTFPSNETVVVEGIPVNASYKLKEISYTGYNPTQVEFTGTITEDANEVTFENKHVVANNLLTVTNTVNVDGVNPALQSVVRAKEDFEYKTTQKDSANEKTDTINNNQKKDYDDGFDTSSMLTIKQTDNTILKFDTTYEVIDRADNNNKINSGSFDSSVTNKTIDEFKLVNGQDKDETASMQVNFVNTPAVGNLVITKSQLNSKGNPETDAKTFGYKLLVDVDGGTDYKPYNLSYRYTTSPDTQVLTMNNGNFEFASDKTVVVYGIPVNATYKLEEVSYTGYTPTQTEFVGTITENGATAGFVNTHEPPAPPENRLTVTNTVVVDGVNPALQTAVRENESFDYNTVQKNSQNESTDTINDGQSENYDNEFDTGSKLTINQSEDNVLLFDTTYNVIDCADSNKKVGGGSFNSSDTKTTDEFTLINGKDDEDTAHIQVDFYNTPVVTNLIINKTQLASDGSEETDAKTFGYQLLVDLSGGTDYKPYNLNYRYFDSPDTDEMIMNGGNFEFPSDKTVLVYGIPVNASYKLQEVSYTGYTPSQTEFTGKLTQNGASVEFVNTKIAPPSTEPDTEPTTETTTETEPTTEAAADDAGEITDGEDTEATTEEAEAASESEEAATKATEAATDAPSNSLPQTGYEHSIFYTAMGIFLLSSAGLLMFITMRKREHSKKSK